MKLSALILALLASSAAGFRLGTPSLAVARRSSLGGGGDNGGAGAIGASPRGPLVLKGGRGEGDAAAAPLPPVEDVAVILLAGGVGSRMKAGMPKQFLELRGKPVLTHSLELFLGLPGVGQVVLVIAEEYRAQFASLEAAHPGKLVFAAPGKERQDSVLSGLDASDPGAPVVCIHDAARPLVTPAEIYQVLADGFEHGAAVLGVPMKATVKESADGEFVLRTVDR